MLRDGNPVGTINVSHVEPRPHSTGDEPNARQVIYRVLEETAFTTALEAYAYLYPKQNVDDIVEGGRRGSNAHQRTAMDWWAHRLLMVPAVATDTGGNEIRGYWYSYSGGGTLAPTSKRTTGLLQFIRTRLDSTAVVVTNVRDGAYETDGRAYLGLKRDAHDSIPDLRRAPAQSNSDRLNELKTMRERGLITEEEYQAKRQQILVQDVTYFPFGSRGSHRHPQPPITEPHAALKRRSGALCAAALLPLVELGAKLFLDAQAPAACPEPVVERPLRLRR